MAGIRQNGGGLWQFIEGKRNPWKCLSILQNEWQSYPQIVEDYWEDRHDWGS